MPLYAAEEKGYVALVNPPAQTNAGANTVLTFAQEVNHLYVQNNTAANVFYAIDTPASPGSLVLVPGALLAYYKEATQTINLYTAAAQNINGVAGGNIVVMGAL